MRASPGQLLRRALGIRLGVFRQHAAIPLSALRLPPPPAISSDAPRVALVTPSYNQAAFVGRTIDSVLAQNYPGLEYVVQDGGSSDDTRKILASYAGCGVQVVIENDAGQADAINRGLARTSAPIMGWLNSDDLLLPGALARVAGIFVSHPEVDVVYGNRLIIDENDGVIGAWVLPRHDANVLQTVDYVPQETMFWRRRAWELVGASIDVEYDFAIDWDLILRFLDTGCQFYHSSAFLGAFRHHPAQKTEVTTASIGRMERARLRARRGTVSRMGSVAAHAWFLAAHRAKHSRIWASVAPDNV